MLGARFQGGTITLLLRVLAAALLAAPLAATAKPSAEDYAFFNARDAFQTRNKAKLDQAAGSSLGVFQCAMNSA